jgi:hypothetical protein
MLSMKAAAPLRSNRVRHLLGTLLTLAGLVTSAAISAQSSSIRTVTVPFASAGAGDGYVNAAAGMTYAFTTCQGEMHIAYSLNEGSATAGPSYILGGKTYQASGAPPQPSSIHFAGTVYRGPSPVGTFSDGLAGKSLGMGCFSGQTQKIANVADVLGAGASAAQVGAYLNSLTVQVRPGEVLRSAAQESRIRSELRRAEADAAATARKAEQEAQAKAKREAEQLASDERAAEAQWTAQAHAEPAAAGAGSAPIQAQPTPPPLTRDERIANAIASDKVLADERLEKQRAIFAQQQATMANAHQQQTEAMIAAAPAALELAGSIYGALDAWDARVKARAYNGAQLKLAGKCRLANGMAAPKDGEIQLGVEITASLSKADCGPNPASRYKAFHLDLPEATRVRFTIRAAKWRHIINYMIDVRDLENRSHMSMGWEEWGAFQKVNSKNVELPAGVYIVTVSNGTEDIFAGFDLRVDPMGPDWQPLAVAPASVHATQEAAKVAAIASESTGVAAVAEPPTVPGAAYLGISVAPGERAVVSAVDPGSPAAMAGIVLGDELERLQANRKFGFLSDVAFPKDQSGVDAWLDKVRAGAKATIFYVRNGQRTWKYLRLGTRP